LFQYKPRAGKCTSSGVQEKCSGKGGKKEKKKGRKREGKGEGFLKKKVYYFHLIFLSITGNKSRYRIYRTKH